MQSCDWDDTNIKNDASKLSAVSAESTLGNIPSPCGQANYGFTSSHQAFLQLQGWQMCHDMKSGIQGRVGIGSGNDDEAEDRVSSR